jgi:hypothetical protein
MKSENNQRQRRPQLATVEEPLLPQQLWPQLSPKQQQVILQRMAQICWMLTQPVASAKEAGHDAH